MSAGRVRTLSRVYSGKLCRQNREISTGRGHEDYYIQRSKTHTMHFQRSLPRLPIPKLADSCQRYLAAQKPILSEEEYTTTEQLTKEFQQAGSIGNELHKCLLANDKENKHTSFIADYWYDMYLRDRRSIVINHNPFLIFKDDPRNPSQIDRAAQIIWSTVRFYYSLRDNLLRPEVFHLNPAKTDKPWFDNLRFIPSSFAWYGALAIKAFPLDMSQYNRLFNSTRIPHLLKDKLVTFPEASHIIVMRNDHLYKLNVIQSNGEIVDINEIYANLESIKSDSSPSPTHPISFLSTLNRTSWAEARNELVANDTNASQLELIDSALFVISLDESNPVGPVDATRVFLHNYGYNRWFDKSVQYIVCNNSAAGISFEHAWGDGVAVLRLFNEIYDETINRPRPLLQHHSPVGSPPQKLSFSLSENLKKLIDNGRQNLKEQVDSMSVDLLMNENLTKKFLKSKNLSPDGVIQLAFQIAYYRQYKTSPSTYESCSTAAFRHGRTETIRPASVSTMKCAKSFEADSGASKADKIKLINEAVSWHSKLVREAATGKGFDRHLLALKCLAESDSLSVPFFEDPGYDKLNKIILSTSTLFSDAVQFGGFGPVNADSYAIGYSVMNDMIGSNVVTYPTRDGKMFVNNLNDVVNEIYSLLKS